jgi:WD40 repeat protein
MCAPNEAFPLTTLNCEQVEHSLSSGLDVSHVTSLANHQKSVNCIRFSPTGKSVLDWGPLQTLTLVRLLFEDLGVQKSYWHVFSGAHLVSAGDGGEMILWRAVASRSDDKSVEDWKAAAVLRSVRPFKFQFSTIRDQTSNCCHFTHTCNF